MGWWAALRRWLLLDAMCCLCGDTVPIGRAASIALHLPGEGDGVRGFHAHHRCVAQRLCPAVPADRRPGLAESPNAVCRLCGDRITTSRALAISLQQKHSGDEAQDFHAHYRCIAERLHPEARAHLHPDFED